MASTIASLIMQGAQARAAGMASFGQSVGAGIAGIGERKREKVRRNEDLALRAAERKEAREERDADRRAAREEREEDRGERIRHNKEIERLQEMAIESRGAAARLRAAEDKTVEDVYELKVQDATQGVVGQAAVDGVRGAMDILAPLRARAQQAQKGVPAAVLAEQADGSHVDLIDSGFLLEREKVKYQNLVELMRQAKKKEQIPALRAAMMVQERRMEGLALDAAAKKQDAAVAKQQATERAATEKRGAEQAAAMNTISNVAELLGVPRDQLFQAFRGEIMAGRPPSPETVRAVARSMAPKEPEPTIEQRAGDAVALDDAKARTQGLPTDRERAGLDMQERRQAAEDEWAELGEESQTPAAAAAILRRHGLPVE